MICPRCDSDKVRVMVKSPVGDVWEVYICEKCWYSWRSTETIKINPKFKLNDEKIANLGVIPPVPPLKVK
ncbi:non-oxidative hydroxyarylic acid decarboxylases subunit D [Paenibacillus thiaminolyticus]|uniref:non-oxidative hydroxyarylic acid decarboxylases subunit D n=1 Tax=Paenibacillus thiaminolyticus TaxID=49283 RepID=UPI0035A5FA6B